MRTPFLAALALTVLVGCSDGLSPDGSLDFGDVYLPTDHEARYTFSNAATGTQTLGVPTFTTGFAFGMVSTLPQEVDGGVPWGDTAARFAARAAALPLPPRAPPGATGAPRYYMLRKDDKTFSGPEPPPPPGAPPGPGQPGRRRARAPALPLPVRKEHAAWWAQACRAVLLDRAAACAGVAPLAVARRVRVLEARVFAKEAKRGPSRAGAAAGASGAAGVAAGPIPVAAASTFDVATGSSAMVVGGSSSSSNSVYAVVAI